MTADGAFARVERRGAVAVITIDRPPVNAVSHGFMASLLDAVQAVSDSDAAAVVLTSALERVFCAGADLREQLDEEQHAVRAQLWRDLLDAVRQVPVPVVAAVRGACIGGGVGLVTQCDLRVAGPSATFSLPEVKVGRAGGATHLRRFVSEGRVRRAMFTGEPIDAATAIAWGLVDELVDEDDWPGAPVAVAARIAEFGRDALVLLKRALDDSESAGADGYLAEQAVTEAMRRQGLAVVQEG